MKKLIGILLAVSVLFTTLAMGAVSAETEKKFVVDGNLDVWYLSNAETDLDDPNYYHFEELDPIMKSNGVDFYSGDVETAAEVYTAYDEQYVYIYVKVWDEELIDWSQELADKGYNSSSADSLEIWFDPDPESQTHYEDGTPREEVRDNFCNQTGDPTQGDIQIRLIGYDMERHDYHDVIKPGYNGISFKTWVMDPTNFCCFTFENEPRETSSGIEVSSGYGVEARFPRSTYNSDRYRINIAVNNSADYSDEFYALAIGDAWWMDYASCSNVIYDDANNPFFAQSEEALAQKSVKYTDSEVNATGAGAGVVNAIAELPETVNEDNKATVEAIVSSYNALDQLQKGYVQYKNFATLKAAADALGIELNDDITPPVEENLTVEEIIALINQLPEEVTLADEAAVNRIAAAMEKLTEEELEAFDEEAAMKIFDAALTIELLKYEKMLGDVNSDKTVNAEDALMALKAAVDKIELTEEQMIRADVNADEIINAEDALEILQFAVGKIDQFSALDFEIEIG